MAQSTASSSLSPPPPPPSASTHPSPHPGPSSPSPPTFLTLPLEIRLEIYSHLLLVPPYNRAQVVRVGARLHPAILAACAQTHAEAAPLLYGANAFFAHDALLTALPRLRPWHAPVPASPRLVGLIRRWHLRVRLDGAEPPWDAAAAAAAFSGADELVVDLWALGFGHQRSGAVLRRLERVRGVRTVNFIGSMGAFEDYVVWLRHVITLPVGAEPEEQYWKKDVLDGEQQHQ